MKAIFGWKSTIWCFLLFSAVGYISFKKDADLAFNIFFLACLFVVFAGTVKLIIVTPEKIRIIAPLNPFFKKIDLDFKSISNVALTFTKFKNIVIVTKNGEIIERTIQYLGFDEDRLIEKLQSYNVEAYKWP